MKLGLMYDLRNPERWRRPWPEHYAEFLEHIVYMEQLGFELVVFPEHHFDPDGYNPSPTMMMTAVALRTKRMLVGSNLFIIPNHHPVRLAEEMAVLDNLSNGRVVFKAGAGALRSIEPRGLGWDERTRFGRSTEGLDIIRRCWTEDVFDHDGRYWRLEGVRVLPKPVQKPHPPIYAPANNPKSLARNARLGYGANMGFGLHGIRDMGEWRRWQADWTAALEAHGRTAPDCPTSCDPLIFVTDDPERAWHKHKEGILHVAQSYARMLGQTPIESADELPGKDRIFLTPDDCLKLLRDYYGEALPDQFCLQGSRPGMTFAEAAEFHRAFIEKVWPRFNNGATPAA